MLNLWSLDVNLILLLIKLFSSYSWDWEFCKVCWIFKWWENVIVQLYDALEYVFTMCLFLGGNVEMWICGHVHIHFFSQELALIHVPILYSAGYTDWWLLIVKIYLRNRCRNYNFTVVWTDSNGLILYQIIFFFWIWNV